MSPRLLLLLSLLSVIAGAAWRWELLSTRPLHADEAVQAWQTWQLLRGEGYRYDPVDRHGPWLYFGTAALETLRGGDATTLNDVRVRTFAWLAGVATLLLIAGALLRYLGPLEAALGSAFAATSPFAVLYHGYFVQEAWLALFTWALAFVGLAWLERPRWSLAIVGGLLAGLMQATKETSVLHFAALAAGWFLAARARGPARPSPTPGQPVAIAPPRRALRLRLPQLAASAGAAAGIYALFYSSFGQEPAGLLDGIRTYLHQWRRTGDPAHEYPFYHYFALLFPHTSGGVRWGEPLLLGAALLGGGLAFRRTAPPAARALAGTTAALLLIYSLIPYKTPWLLLTPVLGMTMLAAHAGACLARFRRWGLALAALGAVLLVAQSAARTRLALERYPGDARNPYFYQQTPRQFDALLQRLQELQRFEPRIAVVSPDHAWPLPWYLRGQEQTGYFAAPPEGSGAYDVLVWDNRIPAPVAWPSDAVVELHGLRPNVLLQLVIRPRLWQQWEEHYLGPVPSGELTEP